MIIVHHASKGNQGNKSVIDVGAGAGSQSRATDTHLILRPHEQPDVVVMEAVVRSWPPVAPLCLRWGHPLWVPDLALDPANLLIPGTRRQTKAVVEKPEPVKWTARKFVAEFVTAEPQSEGAIIDAAIEAGLSRHLTGDLIQRAKDQELMFRWNVENIVQCATRPPALETQCLPLEPTCHNIPAKCEAGKGKQIVAHLLAHPDDPVGEVAKTFGVSSSYVHRLRKELRQTDDDLEST